MRAPHWEPDRRLLTKSVWRSSPYSLPGRTGMLAWLFSHAAQEMGNPSLGPCPVFDFPAGAASARRWLCPLHFAQHEGRRGAAAGLLCASPAIADAARCKAGVCGELIAFYKKKAGCKFQSSARTAGFHLDLCFLVLFKSYSGILCCCLRIINRWCNYLCHALI